MCWNKDEKNRRKVFLFLRIHGKFTTFYLRCKHSVKSVLFFRKIRLSFKVSPKCSENFERLIGCFCCYPDFAV